MLVLTRGLRQQIIIGHEKIKVTVLEVKGGRVRLGIEAPPHVSVRRQELEPTTKEPVNEDDDQLVSVPH